MGSLFLSQVPVQAVQAGMSRFSFLLETCMPGSVPDVLLIGAILDLVRINHWRCIKKQLWKSTKIVLTFIFQPKAPVITRACYLLECAYFVHQCNRGQWPSWLKMNLPSFSRPSRGQSLAASAFGFNQPLMQRRTQVLQLQASKLFYQWAEVKKFVTMCIC